MAQDEYEWTENDSVVVWRLLSEISLSSVVKGDFFILTHVSTLANDMRGSRHQKLIWIGPISENVSLRVISVVAKFHAFIISLNNFGR